MKLIEGLTFVILASACTLARAEPAAAPAESTVRFGISARTITGTNRAVASLKVWIESIAREQKLPVEPVPLISDRLEDFATALVQREIDVVTATVDEFVRLEQAVPLAGLYTQTAGGNIAEEHVLLVRAESPHRTLAVVRGTRLLVLSHPSTTLAPAWLDVELARTNLPSAPDFFRGKRRS